MPVLRKTIGIALLMAVGTYATIVQAAPMASRRFLSENGCFACHSVNSKKVGPAFSWIAYHYRGKPQEIPILARKVITGGKGYWAPWTYGVAMTPHPGLGMQKAEAMVRWVLARHPVRPPNP